MKKAFPIIIVLVLASSMSGCTSMLKSMGGVTKAELAAQEDRLTSKIESTNAAIAEIDNIKVRLEELSKQIENTALTIQEIEMLKAQLAQITTDLEKISDTTLLNLAKLINDALSQTSATESK